MPMPLIDISGQRFGRLQVRCRDPLNTKSWICKCDCGIEKSIGSRQLRIGNTKSCGCLLTDVLVERNQKMTKHGQARSRSYGVWRAMIQRCTDRKGKAWVNYGGRGVTVCTRWLTSFENFYADMGDPPAGMQIERVDNSRGYEPGNCTWAPVAAQARNRRNNVVLDFRGRSQVMSDWAAEFGINPGTLRHRLQSGWTVDAALTTPVR